MNARTPAEATEKECDQGQAKSTDKEAAWARR